MSRSLITVQGDSFSLIKPLVGYRSVIEEQLRRFPFRENVFLMLRFRDENKRLSDFIIRTLKAARLNGIRADHPKWNLTNNVFNPVAVLYCCKYGIALFDEPEADQSYNPNVIYELGMMHCLDRECLILKNVSFPEVPFDLIKDLYMPYKGELAVRTNVQRWLQRLALGGAKPSRVKKTGESRLESAAVAAPIGDSRRLVASVVSSPDDLAATGFEWRITSKKEKTWTVSCSIKLTNNRKKPTVVRVQILFLDKRGFALEDHTGPPTPPLANGENLLYTSSVTMNSDLAKRIRRAMATVSVTRK